MNQTDVQVLRDQRDIEQILIRYAVDLDEHQWAGLDEVFVPEATATYHGIGDFTGRDGIRNMVRSALERCGRTQHLLGNYRIIIDGDKATAKCYLQAIHLGLGDYAQNIMTVWGEYRDRLERRPEGWRIVHRELEVFKVDGDIGPMLL
ncbi:nuclear transport factor 2 family protein [Aromatoleum toluolicum]|uniref:Nuclear transport factor 2 family protein n=1 Tax=Aromatoleum toluolicum TaxID=90060 RepID=A0ABX1NAR2_9RHOO|nr:nuclear transport factor 2 family protein [Aromatoleum toluolicum]NMF96371.1 nuclear transport factor 2 family protein [Aromatoleum toluolicum]